MTATRFLTRVLAPIGLVAVASLGPSPLALAAGAPYLDPSVRGRITLCDAQGHPVTSGDTRDLPNFTSAISSAAPTGPWAVKNAKATLYAFQPRKDVDPGDWSGQQLSGSSYYSTVAHPKVEVTTGDKNLVQAIGAFPPQWDGFVQLRIYISAYGAGQYTETYPAVDIKVTGTRWTAVDPGRTACGAGKSYSTERLVLPASKFPKPVKVDGSSTTGAAVSSGSSTGIAASGASVTRTPGTADIASSTSAARHTSPAWPWVLGALAVAAGAGALSLGVRSRRRIT